jgi:hypothetical protein
MTTSIAFGRIYKDKLFIPTNEGDVVVLSKKSKFFVAQKNEQLFFERKQSNKFAKISVFILTL